MLILHPADLVLHFFDIAHEHHDCHHQRHSSQQLERIGGDYDNGWKLEDGRSDNVDKPMNSRSSFRLQLSDHTGFGLFIGLII